MVKIKQVATKKPRNYYGSFFPVKKAIKSVSTNYYYAKAGGAFAKHVNRANQLIAQAKKNKMLQLSNANSTTVNATDRMDIESNIMQDEQNSLQELKKPRFLVYSLPRKTFQTLCKEFSHKYLKDSRFTKEALEALQLAVEDFMVGFFEDAALCMRHAKRKTLQLKDLELVARLRKIDFEPI